jgi:hypothetical protein
MPSLGPGGTPLGHNHHCHRGQADPRYRRSAVSAGCQKGAAFPVGAADRQLLSGFPLAKLRTGLRRVYCCGGYGSRLEPRLKTPSWGRRDLKVLYQMRLAIAAKMAKTGPSVTANVSPPAITARGQGTRGVTGEGAHIGRGKLFGPAISALRNPEFPVPLRDPSAEKVPASGDRRPASLMRELSVAN